jgi:hypothetical protein
MCSQPPFFSLDTPAGEDLGKDEVMTQTNPVPNGRQHDEPSPGWLNDAKRDEPDLQSRLVEREFLIEELHRLRRERQSLLEALADERESRRELADMIKLSKPKQLNALPARHTHPRLG